MTSPRKVMGTTMAEKILGSAKILGDADIAGKIADRVGRLRRIKEGLNG